MMKSAEPGTGGYGRKRRRPAFHWPSTWRVLCQRIMDPVIVVEGDVLANQASQMWFVPGDDVIEDLAATTADPALRSPVLPWRLHTGAHHLETGCLKEADDIGIEFRIAVENDISVGTSLGECFT